MIHQNSESTNLIRRRDTNLKKADWVLEKILNAAEKLNSELKRKPKIACLGLTYKPNSDDLRGSSALYIYESLIKKNFEILAVEPNLEGNNEIALVELNA